MLGCPGWEPGLQGQVEYTGLGTPELKHRSQHGIVRRWEKSFS